MPRTDSNDRRPLVLVQLMTNEAACQEKLRAIYRSAREHAWNVVTIEPNPFSPKATDVFRTRRPDGIIMDSDTPWRDIPMELLNGVPCVKTDYYGTRPHDGIYIDNATIADKAARILLRTGYKHFAFIRPPIRTPWAEERELAFVRAIAEAGYDCTTYPKASGIQAFRGSPARLHRWLISLPKPCGILAAVDMSAKETVLSCRALGLRVPQDIAIIGIGDDESICESTFPAISSIAPDFTLGGELAARLLDARMTGADESAIPRTYGMRNYTCRESTPHASAHSELIAAALSFIRNNATHGITVEHVVRSVSISRRSLEMFFKTATGHTIHDEIQETKLRAVQQMLTHTKKSISAISDTCGYGSSVYLMNLFKRHFGMTMQQYRTKRGLENHLNNQPDFPPSGGKQVFRRNKS